jgi:glycosyltransferase
VPRLSLVTACFNSVQTLPDTLDSVRVQGGADFEHILVDGGSQDGTRALIEAECARPGSRITRWRSERDGGIFDALNKGIGLAAGDVLGFLHADDVLADPYILQKVVKCFSDASVAAVYGDLLYVRREDTNRVVRYWKAGEFSFRELARGWMPPHPTLYVRRSWYAANGGFDTSYRIASDYDLMLRLLAAPGGRVVYLPEVIVRMRLGGNSNRSLGNIIRKSAEDYRALKANKVGGLGALMWKNLRKLPQFFTAPPAAPST